MDERVEVIGCSEAEKDMGRTQQVRSRLTPMFLDWGWWCLAQRQWFAIKEDCAWGRKMMMSPDSGCFVLFVHTCPVVKGPGGWDIGQDWGKRTDSLQ
jgi:hypothetical protein